MQIKLEHCPGQGRTQVQYKAGSVTSFPGPSQKGTKVEQTDRTGKGPVGPGIARTKSHETGNPAGKAFSRVRGAFPTPPVSTYTGPFDV